MVAKRDGDLEYLERLEKPRATTSTGSSATSTGTCSTRCSCSATSTPTCTRPTCSSSTGDAIGYVDFGIVGQLPNRVRESLTRYSWLLFRGEVEPAVRELMRWLAPGPATDAELAQWQLIRVHQAFLYDAIADRSRVTAEAPGPIPESRENPYSKLAVDILDTIRVQQLTMSPSIVGWLKMLVTLGALRHQLAVDYDLADNVRRFVRRLARQQGLALADPRQALDRLYGGAGQVQARARLPGVPRGPGVDDRRGDELAARLPQPDREREADDRATRGGRARWWAARCTWCCSSPTKRSARCRSRGPTRLSTSGCWCSSLILIAALINYVRGLGQND